MYAMQRHTNAIFISVESVVVIIVETLEIHTDKQAHRQIDGQLGRWTTGSQKDKHTID